MVKLIVALVILAAIIAIVTYRWYKRSEMSPKLLAAIEVAQDARAQYHHLSREHRHRVTAAEAEIARLKDPKGRRLGFCGGIVLWERWIQTPQSEGPLIGVRAEAHDDTSISQRLTVTRMVAFGIFSLAAPKRKTTGNAYVVVEGPDVNGVGMAPDGPEAYNFAAVINNAAHAAEVFQAELPARLAAARRELSAARDESQVEAAHREYEKALQALPPAQRDHLPKRLKVDDWVD